MTVETQLRALGAHIDRDQRSITVDDIRRSASLADSVVEDLQFRLTTEPNGFDEGVDHEMQVGVPAPDQTAGITFRRTSLLLTAAAILLAFVAGLVVANESGDDSPATRPATTSTEAEPQPAPSLDAEAEASLSPAEVIEEYREALNAKDLDAVIALFTEESTFSGHPAMYDGSGLTSIRALHAIDTAMTTDFDAYEFRNVETIGNTVTWDHHRTNADGDVDCGEGHRAVVDDGKILSWTYAPQFGEETCR